MNQLKRTQQLHCDLATAWKFFSSPHKLSFITPKDLGFKVLSPLTDESIYKGMVIDYKVSPVFGIPMSWQTVITQVDYQQSFTDFQQKGPYKYWNHFHEFIPNEHGVLVKDTVDYELPFGIIGTIGHLLLVKRRLQYIFDYRRRVLEALFNSQNRSR